jgi:large subunit ribosomal protein L18
MASVKSDRRQRIKYRIRKRLSGTSERPRLSVFRSNTRVYAQIIDDVKGLTLVSYSTIDLEGNLKTTTVDSAKQIGSKLAEKAVAAGITAVVFDRSGYLYHGKIKALADGARESGLKF